MTLHTDLDNIKVMGIPVIMYTGGHKLYLTTTHDELKIIAENEIAPTVNNMHFLLGQMFAVEVPLYNTDDIIIRYVYFVFDVITRTISIPNLA